MALTSVKSKRERVGARLLLLGSLEPDGFIVDKDALALVRFWFTPAPDLACKQTQLLLIGALEYDPIRLWNLRLDAIRYGKENGMRVAQPDMESDVVALIFGCLLGAGCALDFGLLGGFREEKGFGRGKGDVEFGAAREGVWFDRGTVTHADEFERDGVALGDAGECVGEERAGEAPSAALLLLGGVLDGERDGRRVRAPGRYGCGGSRQWRRAVGEDNAVVERNNDFPLGAFYKRRARMPE